MKNTYKVIASLVGAAILIAMVVVSFWAFNQIKKAAASRQHSLILINRANDLMSSLIDAETGQRGYSLTGDEVFLKPYLAVCDSIKGRLNELRHLTLIGDAHKRLDVLKPLIGSKLSYLAYSIKLRRNHDMSASLENVRSSQGNRLMDSIRAEMRGFIQIEEEALDHHEAEFQSNMRYLFITIVIIGLIMLLFAFVLTFLTYQETQHLLLKTTKMYEDEAREYAESIINTVREPLIALDKDLRVVTASRSFYEVFKVKPEETVGQLIYDLGNKQWDIHKLRELLETILPQKATFDNYEVEHDFATIGRRTMLLNARQIKRESGKRRIILLAIEDITARREIENGLEKARKELETIKKSADDVSEFAESVINTVREPLISLDQDLRVVSVSRSFYEVFKVKPEETVGQLIYDLGNKQWDIPKLRELLETILPQKATFDNYEVEHDFATIGRRIMLLNARQIKRVLGKERIILLAIEDITERREIENGLEKVRKELEITKISEDAAREYSESIINTVREPLIAMDQDLRVVSVSRSFYEVFKVKPEETVGQLIYDLGNKQWNIPKLRELLETILPQKATFDNYEVEHDFTTIGRRIMLLNARQIKRVLGKERIILLSIEDITARREIENGLEKVRKELEVTKISEDAAREYAESVINTVREPLISLDQDLRVVSVSRSFYEVFKVKPEETVGQLIYDLGNKQWNIPKLRELLETILPQKATFDNYEVEHDFAAIGRRIMLLNARQIHRVLGKERIILLAIEDITERREIENGLEKAHEELQELAIELKRTTKAKSIFLANMSHELRTPLNSINGFSEVLYDQTFGPLNDKQKKYVNNVLTSGKHLLLLINQILDMAKVESGKMKTSLSTLPLKSLLNEISLLIADLVSKKKLQMQLEIADDLPNIEADELKVKEIIYNLLSNAVKFTPEGGNIGMRAKNTGSDIEVEVWDTGDGIAPENMEKIFEGFFRVDTPYSRVTEGTGLGLPLSKKLVELHGGKLSVESKGLNKGTLVRFTLPIISREVIVL
ncbi:MAG: PAS domain-containing protein [Elusimicrobia bacterium]|nr:PAS domain-containing protein [Candidatus Liberimonas magnetica]